MKTFLFIFCWHSRHLLLPLKAKLVELGEHNLKLINNKKLINLMHIQISLILNGIAEISRNYDNGVP